MAVRRVELRLSDPGYEDVAKHLDELALKLDRIKAKFDELSKKVVSPKVEMSGLMRMDTEIDKVNAKLDKLGHKRVTATVSIRTDSNLIGRDLSKLVSGGGGGNLIKDAERLAGGAAGGAASGAGGAGGGILSALAGANNSYMGALIAALVGYGASIGPAIIPFGLAGLFGGGAAGGAIMLGSKAHQQILQLQQQLFGITGNTKVARQQRAVLQQRIATIRQSRGPELQLFGGVQQLGHQALSIFNDALTTKGRGFSGGPNGHPGTSFLQGLMAILQAIGPFLKQIGPLFGEIFRASLPSLQAFMKIMIQFTKAVMPAVLQVINQLNSSGAMPILVRGFLYLSNGIAGFIKNLGPGIKAGAIIFKTSMMIIGATLRAIGSAATGFAIMIADVGHGITLFAKNLPHWFDVAFHTIATLFDTWRHNWAHIWDSVYQATIGNVIRIDTGIIHWFDHMYNGIQNFGNTAWNFLRRIWDNIWSFITGSVRKGVSDVTGEFHRLPGDVINTLMSFALGSKLWSWAKNLLQMIINGAKSMWSTVTGWFANLGKGILHAIGSLFHFGSPSKTMYNYGKWIVQGLHQGIKDHLAPLRSAAAGMHGAIMGGSPGAAQNYARGLLGSYGWGNQWGFVNAVAMRESGWRMNAQNPTSPAYGIAQFIKGPSEYYQWGGNPNTIAGQVTAFFNYIRGTYGSPARAWQHELNYGWYDRGGVLKQGVTMALNTTGHDEYISTRPGGAGGGNVYINIHGAVDADATARQVIKILKRYQSRHGGVSLNLA